jgi:tRNA A37 threonylcarbamoyltransferase TsaD
LVKKSVKALKQTGLKRLVIAGGVSANLRLRHHADLLLNVDIQQKQSLPHYQYIKQARHNKLAL